MSLPPYPFSTDIKVIFRDLDTMGHVNNAVYFTYFETARANYLNTLFALKDIRQLPVIVAEATCTYKSPAYFDETLQVGVGISRFGVKSFDIHYRITTAGDDRLVAVGKSVQVVYDYQQGKTIAVPPEVKAKVDTFQGDWSLPPA